MCHICSAAVMSEAPLHLRPPRCCLPKGLWSISIRVFQDFPHLETVQIVYVECMVAAWRRSFRLYTEALLPYVYGSAPPVYMQNGTYSNRFETVQIVDVECRVSPDCRVSGGGMAARGLTLHIYTCKYVHTFVFVCVCVHVCMYVHTCMSRYVQTESAWLLHSHVDLTLTLMLI